MKKITLFFASVFCLTAITNSHAQSMELADYWNPNATYTVSDNLDFSSANQGGIIYSNGPYFNQAGTPDLSILQNVTLMGGTFGVGHANTSGFRIADDWVLTEAVDVVSIDFYAYQTGSTTTSTFNFMTLRIWDGNPSEPSSNIIYGDNTTNVLSGTTWTGAYRVLEDAQTGTTRPIMRNTVNTPGLILTPGTYWLDWNAGGTLGSGPWAPPIAILGQAATGNGLQYDPGTMIWSPLVDGGNMEPQGFPFDVTGMVLSIANNVLEGFTYYPNPVKDILNVNAKGNIEAISVYNVLGQELISISPKSLQASLNLSALSNGMYILKATVNGETGTFNIVKK